MSLDQTDTNPVNDLTSQDIDVIPPPPSPTRQTVGNTVLMGGEFGASPPTVPFIGTTSILDGVPEHTAIEETVPTFHGGTAQIEPDGDFEAEFTRESGYTRLN